MIFYNLRHFYIIFSSYIYSYNPYFYIQIPDEFNQLQINDFFKAFDATYCEDYDTTDINKYNDDETILFFNNNIIIK